MLWFTPFVSSKVQVLGFFFKGFYKLIFNLQFYRRFRDVYIAKLDALFYSEFTGPFNKKRVIKLNLTQVSSLII